MFRLMIVDDERHVVDWLYELFTETSELELDICKAYSANQALSWLERVRVDIVLTDIKMPGMSGLELLKEVVKRWPQCKVIFLTGYNEFDYIYKAVKYEGVIGYLLKTEDDDVIVRTVLDAIRSLKEDLKKQEFIGKAREQESVLASLRGQDFLRNVLHGEYPYNNAGFVQKGFRDLGIQLDVSISFLLVAGRIDDYPSGLGYAAKSNAIHSIDLAVAKYVSHEVSCSQVSCGESNLVWVMQPFRQSGTGKGKAARPEWDRTSFFIKGMLETIQEICCETMKFTLSFLIHTEPVPFRQLSEAFTRLQSLIRYRIGPETGLLLTDSQLSAAEKKQEDYGALPRQDSPAIVKELEGYLECGRENDFFNLFHRYTEDLQKITAMSCLPAKERYVTISLLFMEYINRWRLAEKLFPKIDLDGLTDTEKFHSWDSAVQYLEDVGERLFEVQKSKLRDKSNDLVERIKEYITDNLGSDLSLVRIADYVNYNPSYISRLFKQVSGISLFAFISGKRFDHAKELLEKSSTNIQDIAKSSGFDSSQYFATAFKKMVKMTPQEYRDSFKRSKQIEQK